MDILSSSRNMEGILFDETKKLFILRTRHTEYQMQVDQYGVLRHVWYGEITNHDMSYLSVYSGIGFSGSIDEAGNDRTYSLDTLLQEYPCGGADYRIPALEINRPDGNRGLDLRYHSHTVTQGKYALDGLPAVYGDDAQTLKITLKDQVSEFYVTLLYGVISQYDIITRAAVITNQTDTPITLENTASLCLDLREGCLDWIHFYGRHAMERITERSPLLHGIQESSSKRGTSSHQQNPSVILCSKDCTETAGTCFGAFLIYSGSFRTQIELDQLSQARLVMGIHPELFSWTLEKDQSFTTPEAVLTFSNCGLETLSHNFHRIIRHNICRGPYKLARRPILINTWEAAYFDFNEEKIYQIARQASELGVEMLVLDDGWFGKRNNDCSGLGDWTVNEQKLKGGLKALSDRIRALGMKFGLWVEPEMVSEDSDLYRLHSDWVIRLPDRKPTRGRYQLVLDISRQDVQDYLFDALSAVLQSADISYIKWDMNRSLSDWYSLCLPAHRMGEQPHRYVLGLYRLLERLTHAFPDVLIESCSGGGGRFDAGLLYYSPQIWCSDNTDALDRTKIQYGTSYIYPISAVGSHVSVVPNHGTGRVTPLQTRSITAMAGSFGYELDLNLLTSEEKEAVKQQIADYKALQPLIHDGLYYRLSDPFKDSWAGWEFVSEDRREVLVQGMLFQTEQTVLRRAVRLRGLDPHRLYQLKGDGTIYTGAALMNGGLLVTWPWGDHFPFMFLLRSYES